jgi:ABC-2 type transport system ATP-binding protein
MTDDNVVDVHHLSKSFGGKPAVVDVSLIVKRGEIFGFLGPNGSGKTTTIRMLCGLMTPDTGSGTCLGYDILHDARQIKRLVGYVPQTFSLYKDLTVRENLEFIARVYGEQNYAQCVRDIMENLGLDHYAGILAGGLSGGWKQRLSLGAALIHHPKLLLLDEPTAGVDPKARREFWNDISQLTTQGITALVSTHYMDEAERCNRLAYIVNGHMMAEGTIPNIIHQVNLSTFAVTGADILKLRPKLEELPGVDQVVVMGNELRVSGTNKKLLEQAIAKFSTYKWQATTTNLEEVFIHLVDQETAVEEKSA